ncbi:MAG TPA: hypothetical protein VH186_02985 [Chloroflexia bacterium]|nr:hypothetical protein [Chloroflexia bacterium]
MKQEPKQKKEPKPLSPASRASARFMWLVIIVWIILFLMIKDAFRLGGNPAIMFLIMFALFFCLLFGMRIALIRSNTWWRNFKPRLARTLASIIYRRR